MKVLLDEYTAAQFEAIANPASVGLSSAVELDDDEL